MARGPLHVVGQLTDAQREVVVLGEQVDAARRQVERLFERLGSASFGHPRAHAGLQAGHGTAAARRILPECMHHLGFDLVRTGRG